MFSKSAVCLSPLAIRVKTQLTPQFVPENQSLLKHISYWLNIYLSITQGKLTSLTQDLNRDPHRGFFRLCSFAASLCDASLTSSTSLAVEQPPRGGFLLTSTRLPPVVTFSSVCWHCRGQTTRPLELRAELEPGQTSLRALPPSHVNKPRRRVSADTLMSSSWLCFSSLTL